MKNKKRLRALFLILVVVYVLSPADAFPGLADDVIAVALYLLTWG